MIIFEVNFLLIYKNIDEFGIVCKNKKSVLQENYDHFVWSVFFFSFFFCFCFFCFFVFVVVVFFFFLYEMSKLGVRPIRRCGLYAGKYGIVSCCNHEISHLVTYRFLWSAMSGKVPLCQ